MLETLGRIAEEQGMHDEDEDDDSFDEGAILFTRLDSAPMEPPPSRERPTSFIRDESMGTEGSSSVFVMGDDEEYAYPRDISSFDDSQSTEAALSFARRGSHNSRRSSFMSTDSGASSRSGHSARGSPVSDSTEKQRSARPRRRTSINLTSFQSAGSDDSPGPKGKSFRPLSRLSKLGPSTRRAELDLPKSDSRSAFMTVGEMGNTQLQDAAAAAAVVALSTGVSAAKRIQFVVDDVVLVFLNILNHTNSVDPTEAFTVVPVNKYGFPSGEGHRPAEQQGPYVYVMATVKRVHFDEDVPYYTVVRADTGAEQRADVGKSREFRRRTLQLLRVPSLTSLLSQNYSLDGTINGLPRY